MTPDGCACIRQKFNRNQRFLHRTCIYHFGWPVLIASWVCLSSFTERHQEAGRYHIKRATKAQVRTYESLIEITHVGVHRTTLKSDLMSKYNGQNKGVGLEIVCSSRKQHFQVQHHFVPRASITSSFYLNVYLNSHFKSVWGGNPFKDDHPFEQRLTRCT